jgi:protein TonB
MPTKKRVLVASADAWLRFRLRREMERVSCEVTLLTKLSPAETAKLNSYDIVLTDAALFPEGSRLEAFRALRQASPEAQFVLLIRPGESQLAEQARKSGFAQVVERPRSPQGLPELARQILGEIPAPTEAVPVAIDFQFVLDKAKGSSRRGAGTGLISLIVHSLILTIMVILPLAFTESLDVGELTSTWLAAPPPPPPPPPPPAPKALQARRLKPVTQIQQGRLVAPKAIPKEVKIVVDKDVNVRDVGGVVGGVPGGVAGGQLGGALGGVLGGVLSRNIPTPPAPEPAAPVRVGGNVRPPRIVRRVEPIYPAIAKQARIQGMVRIDAIIDKTGRVVEMKVLSGHPLLAQAALTAVRQWVYEPTYLNERPVAVVLEVTVNFGLQSRR